MKLRLRRSGWTWVNWIDVEPDVLKIRVVFWKEVRLIGDKQ